ncbi:hypothetical protein Slin15195_G127170 [Septoria linicola]|uniref:GPI anchored protein n=1 Tax=Septoria linicola TaxID=215465 RepID=A0A9Q9B8L9_9PEZI|nr:hypothetical protein Slin14017_G083350 [Septoria linicola]USW59398.1 hypothetical protein Slin15195_G127170 [Septoria linicola]
MLHLTKTAIALLALAHHNLAQDMQAIVPPQNNENTLNPIQIEDPSDQTSYISPNSPTPIPSSSASSAIGQIIVCTTLGTEGETCSTFAAMTSFSSLTMSATGGILTASETRSTRVVTSTATSEVSTTTGTTTRTRVSGTESATAAATESGEGSGAERKAGCGLEKVVVGGVLAVVGALLAM